MTRFYTLTHAMAITGISEAEIIDAGERGEFAFNSNTMLIMSPPDFMAWTERRHIQDKAELMASLNERIVKLYVKMALVQGGLNRVEITLKELIGERKKENRRLA